MSVIECGVRGEAIPVTRYCVECGGATSLDVVPPGYSKTDEATRRFSDFANDAYHASVTFDALRSKHDAYDRPLGAHLHADEQPEAICDLNKCRIANFDDTSWKVSSGLFDSGHPVVSDERVLGILPKSGAAQVVAVDLVDVVETDTDSGWRKQEIAFELVDGCTYEFDVDMDDETFEEIVGLTRDLANRADSADADAAKFVRQVDAEISEAGDAESVLRAVADLFAERGEKTRFDHAVAEAESTEDLVAALAVASSRRRDEAELPAVEDADEGSEVPSPTPNNVPARLRHAAVNADPKQVGKYTLGITAAFAAGAAAAPFSTTAGLAVLATSGAATGVYASAHPESVAAQIDPIALAMNANKRGRQWLASPAAGGAGIGSLVGAVEYLGTLDLDEAYAEWITAVDVDTVMRGVELGARRAARSSEIDHADRASALGGLAGLAYGYADLDDEFESVVDEGVTDVLLNDGDSDDTIDVA